MVQNDFLPFVCDCCKQTFCLEHRTYRAHSCSQADHAEPTTIVCPLCAKAVRLTSHEDPNEVFARHTETVSMLCARWLTASRSCEQASDSQDDCDPGNYARIHHRPRCPVPGCKEKLVASNTYECRDCRATVCLKHRFAKDHSCSERAGEPLLSQLHLLTAPPRPDTCVSPAAANRPSRESLAGAAARVLGFVKPGQAAAKAALQRQAPVPATAGQKPPKLVPDRPAVAPAAAHRQSSAAAAETCPLCAQRFASISDLLAHAEVAHAGGQQQSAVSRERCPHCSLTFPTAVALVEHVERSHQQQTSCVLC